MLYAAATGKAIQIIELIWTTRVWREAIGLVLITTAAWGYAKWLKPQHDIPYNKVFHFLGWVVIALLFIIQAALLLMICIRKMGN